MRKMIIVILLLLAVTAGPAAGADDTYIVRPGDTLSGIALKLYGDASKWAELLKANPQVTDPSLIYPGDSLVTGPSEVYSITSGGTLEPVEDFAPLPVTSEAAGPEPVPIPEDLPVEVVRPLPMVSDSRYRSAGYLSKELPAGTVIGSVASKRSLVEGDEIIVSEPAEEGTAFTILRPMQEVYHPRTGEYLGRVLRIIGWADVICRGELSSRAKLATTVDAVNIGDLVVPFDPDDVLKEKVIDKSPSAVCLKKNRAGYIVATQEKKRTLVEGDIVFVDSGRRDGVAAGDQFSVYGGVDPEWPIEYGVLQILRVGESTSTALVVKSDREIAVSDMIQPRIIAGENVSGS